MPAKLLNKLLRKKVRDMDMNLVLWRWSTRTRTQTKVLVLVHFFSTRTRTHAKQSTRTRTRTQDLCTRPNPASHYIISSHQEDRGLNMSVVSKPPNIHLSSWPQCTSAASPGRGWGRPGSCHFLSPPPQPHLCCLGTVGYRQPGKEQWMGLYTWALFRCKQPFQGIVIYIIKRRCLW